MNDQIGSVGPWAREKLDLLGSYLVEYAKILRKQNFRGYAYIDAFASAGIHHVRNQKPARDDLLQLQLFDTTHLQDDSEYQEFISGSPRVALELPYEFTYYVFVDTDPQRIQELASLKREFPSKPIRIHRKNCNEYLRELLIDPRINWKEWRAIVFLDPFGMQMPWSTIESLAQTNSIEIIVNFPVGWQFRDCYAKTVHSQPNSAGNLTSTSGRKRGTKFSTNHNQTYLESQSKRLKHLGNR